MAQVLSYPLRSLCVTNHPFRFDSYESEWSEEHFLLCLRDFLADTLWTKWQYRPGGNKVTVTNRRRKHSASAFCHLLSVYSEALEPLAMRRSSSSSSDLH